MKEKLIIFFLIVLGIISLGGRVWWGSADELNQAEAALGKKDYPSAVLHYEKVILWNFPIWGYSEKAVKGIEAIRQKAQSEKNQIATQYAGDALAFARASTGKSPKNQIHSFKIQVPPRFWSAMVGISLLTWIGLVFFLIGFSFDENMFIRRKAGFISVLILFALVFFLWVYSIQQL
jgi:hypothetical protein